MLSPDDDVVNSVILPDEIWENVFVHLLDQSPKSFLSAAKVCSQWRHLAIRLCKKLCLSKLGKNIIDELYETLVTHRQYSEKEVAENGDLCADEPNGEDGLHVFALYQETRLNSADQILPLGSFENTSIYTADPFLLLAVHPSRETTASKRTFVSIYNSLELIPDGDNDVVGICGSPINDSNIFSSFVVLEEIYDIHFLLLSSPVLLVRTREVTGCLQWIVMPKGCRLNQPVRGVIDSHKINPEHISTESRYLLSIDDLTLGKHSLYETSLDDDRLQLKLDWVCSFQTDVPIYVSKLLRGHIKINSCNGYITTYALQKDLNSPTLSYKRSFDSDSHLLKNSPSNISSSKHYSVQLVASSNFSKDLRYPNQNVFSQDWMFTSTAVSSALLYYWHMDRGREFSWLIGSTFEAKDDSKENESIATPKRSNHLYNIIIGEEITAEVTALQVTRGILLCGTSKGHVLLYKLQEKVEKNNNNLDFLKKASWINVPITDREIKVISGLWTASGLIVAVLDVDRRTTISILPSLTE